MTPKKAKHRRLWPLIFLPFLGLAGGLYVGTVPRLWPFGFGTLDPMTSAALGLLAGSAAMVVGAACALAYRIARRRFTIGNILVTIVVIAVLLGCARSLFF
jgi:hypothetical protein